MSDANKPLFKEVEYAFPFAVERPGALDASPGMTLRDYFAAAALPGLVADARYVASGADEQAAWMAGRAYAIADAMLLLRATS